MSISRVLMKQAVTVKRLLNGTYKQNAFTKYLTSIERKSVDELHNLQAVQLQKILTHTVNNVPYYKQYKNQLKLSLDSAHDDLLQLPVINKDILNEHYDKFIAPKEKQLIRKTTGGTTGQNTIVIEDLYGNRRRSEEYLNELAGMYPGMKRLILKRSEKVHHHDNQKNPAKEYNSLSGTYRMNHTFLNEEKLNEAYKILSTKNIEMLYGQTNSIYEFARYINDVKKQHFHMKTMIVGGQTMMTHHREVINSAFGPNLFDRYSATEFNDSAQECELHNGLHYAPVCFLKEVLEDDNQQHVKEGESGTLCVTLLVRKVMPILRYNIKDIAVYTNKLCSCGRTFPLIKSIDGRHLESISSSKGTFLTQKPIMNILKKHISLIDFQAEQIKLNEMILRIHTNQSNISENEKSKITKDIETILGTSLNIKFSKVDRIPELKNGKTLRVIALRREKKL